MKDVDQILGWIILLAIVAVIVSSGQVDPLLTATTKLLTGLISVIDAPAKGQ